jgi:hypothetical protein
MSCKTFNLTDNEDSCRAIIQGETYSRFAIRYTSDVSTGSPYGTIRNNYEDEAGVELAVFDFYPLTYDGLTDKTTIAPYLTKEATRALPITKFQARDDEEPNVKNCLVYEIGITLTTGVNIVLISSSFVQVIPHT